MLPIVEVFLKIALRRLGPEDLPDSGFLLLLALLAYLATELLLEGPAGGFSAILLGKLAVDAALLFGALWLLLSFTGRLPRYRRTMTAMLGTGALLQAFMIPFNYWWQLTAEGGRGALLPTLAIFALLLWMVAVNGHIVARALSVSFAVGVFIALAFTVAELAVMAQIGSGAA